MARSSYWGKNARRAAKRVSRRTAPKTFLIPILFLILGLAVGCLATPLFLGDDGFSLVGDKEITVAVGESFRYTEEGYRLTFFGRDCASHVQITTNMTRGDDGSYTMDTDAEGVYYIAYTSRHPLWQRGVRLVRTFVVKGGEA